MVDEQPTTWAALSWLDFLRIVGTALIQQVIFTHSSESCPVYRCQEIAGYADFPTCSCGASIYVADPVEFLFNDHSHNVNSECHQSCCLCAQAASFAE